MTSQKSLIALFCCICSIALGQSQKIDSLLAEENAYLKKDTVKVNIYTRLAKAHQVLKSNDSNLKNRTVVYCDKAIELSREIKFKKGEAQAGLIKGEFYFKKDSVVKAFECFQFALKAAEAAGNEALVANISNKIGYIHHFLVRNHKRARYYFQRSYDIVVKRKDTLSIAKQLTNMGSVDFELSNYEEAFKNYEEAFELFNAIHDTSAMALVAGNIGEGFLKLNKPNKAYKYLVLARNFSQRINIPDKVAYHEERLGYLHMQLNELPQAEKLLASSYEFAVKTNFKELERNAAESLWHLYEKKKDTVRAVFFQNKYLVKKEQMMSGANVTLISDLENSREIEKIELQNENEKKIKAIEHQNITQRQNLVIVGVAIILLIIGLALFVTLKRHKLTIKQKKIIEEQKAEVERKNELIEEKQKEILDSINYAKRIQVALLANAKTLDAHLGDNNYFIFFQPKDIVSGDFYWTTSVQSPEMGVQREEPNSELLFLAVCDSTGHGVPGAFMSLLNIGFLSEAVKEKKIYEPHKVLEYVRQRLIDNISKEGQKDGMDAVLLCIDRANRKITYAAANNEPITIVNGRLSMLPKDKMPVGKGEKNDAFNLYSIPYEEGSFIYMYTDGYPDQFGGDKGKKYKYKQLNELLSSISMQHPAQQKEKLQAEFTTWKGELEQVDDVCIIGLRI